MRKLYLVPIIHTSPDLGSLAWVLAQRATAVLGQELWRRHKEIVSGFWDAIAQFFSALDVNGFKIYQDGLTADGAEGLKIIGEGIRQGSKNYEIIVKLLEKGAVLVKTEDLALVKQEQEYLAKIARAKSLKERETIALKYRLAQNNLLRQRDDFIAKRLKETLNEDETGAIFIGAYHDILPKLPAGIQVIQVKDVARVREYHRNLITAKGNSQRLQQLARYMTSSVPQTSS